MTQIPSEKRFNKDLCLLRFSAPVCVICGPSVIVMDVRFGDGRQVW